MIKLLSLLGLKIRPWPPRVRFGLLIGLGVLVLVVTYYGVISPNPLPDHRLIVGWNDVLLHIGAFSALTLVGALLFTPALQVGVVAFAAGLALETIQTASPHHEPSLRDLVADGVGVVLALVVFGVMNWTWTRLSGTALPGPAKTGEPI